jgi:hypothetical protein
MANVSVEKLSRLVESALADGAFAERLFKDPDGIAREQGLTPEEHAVVKQMTRAQFETARRDARAQAAGGELTEADLESVIGGTLGLSAGALGTCTSMIVGRSLIGATGGSYAKAAAGCDCCAWKGGMIGGATVSLPGP